MSLRHCDFHVILHVVLPLLAAVASSRIARAKDDSEASGARVKGVVISADGRPVVGALVAFSGPWRQSQADEAIETETDAAGRFELTTPAVNRLPGAYVGTVWAYARGSGIAHQALTVPAESELRLNLPPGSETRIKVVGPEGTPVVGAQAMHTGLRVATTRNGETIYGAATLPEPLAKRTAVATDSEGVAVLTAMTPDEISGVRCLTQQWGAQDVHRPHGTSREGVVRLRRVGHVRGRVVCENPSAAAGIQVHLTTDAGNAAAWATSVHGDAVVMTDESGRFEATLAAGHLSASTAPRADLPYLAVSEEKTILLATGELEISIRLERAATVRGVVRMKGGGRLDSDAQLMRNVSVRGGHSAFVGLELDRDGVFRFFQPLGKTIEIMRSLREGRHSWVLFQKSPNLPGDSFDIPPIELLWASGRVVDEAGRPVPEARVEQAWMRSQVDGEIVERKLRYGSEPQLLSADAGGRFEVQVAAQHAYRLLVTAEGMGTTLTDWADFSHPEVNAFPDIVLHRSRSLSGRVVDRQGRSLAGAKVFQAANHVKRTESVANQRGEYKLDGLNAGPGFVFARHEGYRFQGQTVKADATRLDIVMTRVDEAPKRAVNPLSQVLTPEEEHALARQVLQPPLERAIASGSGAARRRALETWATLNPHDCLKRLGDTSFTDHGEADAVRIEVAKALFAQEPDKALGVLATIEDGWNRVFCAIELTNAVPAAARDLKLRILTPSVSIAEAIEEPSARVLALALIARKLTETGEHRRAEQIVRQAARQVNDIADDSDECCAGMTHIAVAAALAPYDLQAALQLAPKKQVRDEDENDEARDDSRVELRIYRLTAIARALAESNPTESERIIALVEDPEQQANAIVSLCPKLAGADLARARRLAATIKDPSQRARAEGELAKAIATTNLSVAKDCLREAFHLLAQPGSDIRYPSLDEAECVAALLPVAELVAPEQLEEFFWQTISLAHSDQQLSLDGASQVQVTSAVAAFVARYDREAARLLLGESDPVLRMLGGAQERRPLRAYAAFFAALTSIDPRVATALLDNVSDLTDDADGQSPRDTARRAIVRLLASQGDSRLRTLAELVGIPDYGADDF